MLKNLSSRRLIKVLGSASGFLGRPLVLTVCSVCLTEVRTEAQSSVRGLGVTQFLPLFLCVGRCKFLKAGKKLAFQFLMYRTWCSIRCSNFVLFFVRPLKKSFKVNSLRQFWIYPHQPPHRIRKSPVSEPGFFISALRLQFRLQIHAGHHHTGHQAGLINEVSTWSAQRPLMLRYCLASPSRSKPRLCSNFSLLKLAG